MSNAPRSGEQEFVERLRDVVAQGLPEGETVAAVKTIVSRALETQGWVPERCLHASPDCYARHLLFKDPQDRFAVVVMVWGRGQKTPVHDHGGVWCVEGVYQGRIRVTRYEQEGPAQDDIVHFRRTEVIDAGLGETGVLIPPVEHHSIENASDTTAITVHTYGCDLKSCHVYMPRPDGAYEMLVKPLLYTSVPRPMPGGMVGRS